MGYYRSLGRSMTTMLEIMSSGLPWGVYDDNNLDIVRDVNLVVILGVNYCILPIIVSTCVYLSLNFQSSNASARIHANQTEKMLFENELKQRCMKVGLGAKERMDEEVLDALLKKKKIQVFMTAHNIEIRAREVFDLFDYDEEGTIDLNRFVAAAYWMKKSSHATDNIYSTQMQDYLSERVYEVKSCTKAVGREYAQALERIAYRFNATAADGEDDESEDKSMPLIVSMERHVAFLLHEVERLNEQIKAHRQDTVVLGQLVTIGASPPTPVASPAPKAPAPPPPSASPALPEKALAFDLLATRNQVQV